MGWDMPLRRKPQDWKVENYLDLMEGIYQAAIHSGEEDMIVWEWDNGESYLVKSYYAAMAKGKSYK